MMKFKKTNYKFWHSPFALVVIFCVLLFFGYKIIDLIKKDIETARNKNLVLYKIDNLNLRASTLSKDISRLETEEGEEEIIRGKLQVVKNGEKMVTIVDEESKDNTSTTQKASHGFWNWIKRIFSN